MAKIPEEAYRSHTCLRNSGQIWGGETRCRTGRKRPWSRATLSTDVAELLPGYCSFVFFGLQSQVSACADVRVRMTSGMPSVFVSEATGGARAWHGESNGEYYTPPSAPSCTGRDAQAEVYRAKHAEQTHPNNKTSMDAKIQYEIDL